MKTRGIVATVVVCFCWLYASAQSVPSKPIASVETLMNAREFKASGLDKLSPTELQNLDGWLSGYLVGFYSRVTKAEETTSKVIESEIDGEFHGWDGETIFKLTNGQIWQQAEYDYEYEYEYRPSVLIIKSGSGYKMQVKGMKETVAVKRLK